MLKALNAAWKKNGFVAYLLWVSLGIVPREFADAVADWVEVYSPVVLGLLIVSYLVWLAWWVDCGRSIYWNIKIGRLYGKSLKYSIQMDRHSYRLDYCPAAVLRYQSMHVDVEIERANAHVQKIRWWLVTPAGTGPVGRRRTSQTLLPQESA